MKILADHKIDILLLSASPKKKGNSMHVCESIQEYIPSAQICSLADYSVLPCTDCGYCKEHKGKCRLDKQDDMAKLLDLCLSAKNIVIVTPIYFYHAPSQLKAFIDRTQRFWYTERTKVRDRKLYAVYVAARRKGKKLTEGLDLSLTYFAPHIQAYFQSSICLYGLDKANDYLLFKDIFIYKEKIDFLVSAILQGKSLANSKGKLSDISSFFSSLLFEKRCSYCLKNYSSSEKTFYALCPECTKSLKRLTQGYCLNCGQLLPQNDKDLLPSSCQKCENKPVPWSELRFFDAYKDKMQDLIRHAKFHDNLIYLRTLADLLIPLIYEFPPFDAIVPMPLHPKRLADRGYNQCLEIVKRIHKLEKIPYFPYALKKVRHTKPQSTLNRKERLINVENAFLADSTLVQGKTLLLLDDVSTTGSSLYWASKALLEGGAKKVFVVYIAGAQNHSE